MCDIIKQKVINKVDIINELIHNNVYKMPDGRQFYEATEKELVGILHLQSNK